MDSLNEKKEGVMMHARIFLLCVFLFSLMGCGVKKPEKQPLSTAPAVFSNSGPISEFDLGVPLYPNATADKNESFSFISNSKNGHVKTTSASLKSVDSVDKIEAFYRERLSPNVRISEEQSTNGKLIDIFSDRGNRQVRIQIVRGIKPPGSVIVILTQTRS